MFSPIFVLDKAALKEMRGNKARYRYKNVACQVMQEQLPILTGARGIRATPDSQQAGNTAKVKRKLLRVLKPKRYEYRNGYRNYTVKSKLTLI